MLLYLQTGVAVKRNCWMLQKFVLTLWVTQCKTVTNLCRISLLAFKWWPFQIRRHDKLIHKMHSRAPVPFLQMLTILHCLKEAWRGHFRPLELLDSRDYLTVPDHILLQCTEINFSTEGGFRLLIKDICRQISHAGLDIFKNPPRTQNTL